jgi:hypothetical protein
MVALGPAFALLLASARNNFYTAGQSRIFIYRVIQGGKTRVSPIEQRGRVSSS